MYLFICLQLPNQVGEFFRSLLVDRVCLLYAHPVLLRTVAPLGWGRRPLKVSTSDVYTDRSQYTRMTRANGIYLCIADAMNNHIYMTYMCISLPIKSTSPKMCFTYNRKREGQKKRSKRQLTRGTSTNCCRQEEKKTLTLSVVTSPQAGESQTHLNH